MFQKLKCAFPYTYIFLCSLLMTVFAQSNPLQVTFSGDTAVFIYIAKEILEGRMPYRDVFDHKGPLIYLFDALGLAIDDKIGIWIIELLIIFITFLFAYKIARMLKCNQLFSCAVVTIGFFVLLYYFQGGNLTEEYACVFITVSLYYFLYFFINNDIEKYQVFLTGLSFASVCMLRANMIACWLVMFTGELFECFRYKKYQNIARLILWFSVGTIFVLVPIFVWLYYNDSFRAFVDNYLIFNFIYSSDTLISSKLDVFTEFMRTPPVLFSVPVLLYFGFQQNRKEDWLCMISLLLSVILASMSGRGYAHYGMIFYPFIIYVTSRLFHECSSVVVTTETTTIINTNYKIFLNIILFCYSCCIIFPILSILFSGNITTLLCPSLDFAQNRKIVDIIKQNTNNDDKISVVGNENSIYLLSDRKSASKYTYQFPIANVKYDIWKDYLNEIQELPAKVIILLPGADQVYPYCKIKRILDKHYSLISVVGSTKIFLLKTISD